MYRSTTGMVGCCAASGSNASCGTTEGHGPIAKGVRPVDNTVGNSTQGGPIMVLRCRTIAALLCVWSLQAAATGQVPSGQESAKPMGEVEVVVFGPDGHPAANADVLVR